MRIYVFGNMLIKEDNSPLLMVSILQQKFPHIQFIAVDPNENFPPETEKNVIIIDTVSGISTTLFLDFSDLKNIEKTPVSPHDYDLLLHLLLLKKIGKIDSVRIIGVPLGANIKKEITEVQRIISNLL